MATRPSDLTTGLHLLEQACASGLWGEMLYACGALWSQLSSRATGMPRSRSPRKTPGSRRLIAWFCIR